LRYINPNFPFFARNLFIVLFEVAIFQIAHAN